jgi:hypothetical protein
VIERREYVALKYPMLSIFCSAVMYSTFHRDSVFPGFPSRFIACLRSPITPASPSMKLPLFLVKKERRE